ncbi:MAG: nitrate/nitrite transporter NrtS [Synechococcus sp.]|nr:nitrate/nitrite transporter NrtS [Synechococcus sp.]
MKTYLKLLGDRTIHSTALRVALTVGTILFCINHSLAVVNGTMTRTRWISAIVTYFVPYCVSTHGQMTSRIRHRATIKTLQPD